LGCGVRREKLREGEVIEERTGNHDRREMSHIEVMRF
jgi:hypothetical protein